MMPHAGLYPFVAIVIGLILSFGVASAHDIPAPRGWSETSSGASRTLTKGTSRIEVGDWEDYGGQRLDSILGMVEKTVPKGAIFVSSGGISEESVPGAYSVTRKVTINGRQANSILYVCPGQYGLARIMSLTVDRSKFGDVMSGGLFLERICKAGLEGEGRPSPRTQPAAAKAETRIDPASPSHQDKATNSQTGRDLARENAKIPKASRPVSAYTHLEKDYQGFPVIIVYVGKMMMTFPNGWSTYCVAWDPSSQKPTPSDIGRNKDCELTKDIDRKKDRLQSFKPGERVQLSLGNIGATGYDMGGGTSSSIHGRTVVMTKDGRIALGRWRGHSVLTGSAVTGGSKKYRPVTGRYYLNGHTITIETDEGEILHSFIGAVKEGNEITYLHLAGELYWDRDD